MYLCSTYQMLMKGRIGVGVGVLDRVRMRDIEGFIMETRRDERYP